MNPLKRYPLNKNDTLQAWDSADELLLQHLQSIELSGKRILVMNDSFGALSCGLQSQDITTYTDSFNSSQGLRLNSQNAISPIHRLQDLSGLYDLVVIRIPKNMSFFEDLLCHLSQHLHPQSKVICGAMLKHLAKGSFDLLNKIIGETTTSLAQKKARLVFATFQRKQSPSPYPLSVSIDGYKQKFIHHSNLFSREKLDIGTRFLLENIPDGEFKTILDLGCANGVVGIAAKKKHPGAQIIFSDDSQMAVQSAEVNYRNHFQDSAQFLWTNCYENQAPQSIDLVICNPPFHQGHTVGDFIAWQMFTDSRKALKPGGTLRVIGNFHLQYGAMLKKIFGNSEKVASNSKFSIFDSTAYLS